MPGRGASKKRTSVFRLTRKLPRERLPGRRIKDFARRLSKYQLWMDADALAGQVIKLSLRDLKKFDGKRENLANFVALKQTLMMIGKAKEVNPVTEPTRGGNDAAKKANATMLDLLELYLEDQALTIFRSLKGSLTNNGYLEMKHVISGLNKWYE